MSQLKQIHYNAQAKQRGFTLIELVVVIIILGVLAVIAAPKFISLKSDAYASAMKGVAGAINSGKSMIYSACVISINCDQTAPAAAGNGSGNSIKVQGENIILAYGYPRHTSTGIVRMINIKDGVDFKVTDYNVSGREGLRMRPIT
ncbi:prepilin-type N-terminal cleavage/methylation domain-containing protein [Shewanella sp. SG41-4]|uniref:type II secretion system protein n=1 Tax=Shewanella sp. SG41-4 TaxID=2760976 RepID=UPI001601DB85|nr:prepilin-type N-terminal cleavage/methylation domain-containing protein [Shewanella sp. SG41-4]MBB1441157.1 prepilin-type N-terminal cleavage/methylation domain-containing protein [Shewanella sp. SG41-4]